MFIAKKMEEGKKRIDVSLIYLFHFISLSKCIIMNYNTSHNFITIKEEENAGLSQLT